MKMKREAVRLAPTRMMKVAGAIVAASPEGLDRIQVMQACAFFFGEYLRLFQKGPCKEPMIVGKGGPFFESVSLMLRDHGEGAVPKDICPPEPGEHPEVIFLIELDCVRFALKARAKRNEFLLGKGSAWLASREAGRQHVSHEAAMEHHGNAHGWPPKKSLSRRGGDIDGKHAPAKGPSPGARSEKTGSHAGYTATPAAKPFEVVTTKRRSVTIPGRR